MPGCPAVGKREGGLSAVFATEREPGSADAAHVARRHDVVAARAGAAAVLGDGRVKVRVPPTVVPVLKSHITEGEHREPSMWMSAVAHRMPSFKSYPGTILYCRTSLSAQLNRPNLKVKIFARWDQA